MSFWDDALKNIGNFFSNSNPQPSKPAQNTPLPQNTLRQQVMSPMNNGTLNTNNLMAGPTFQPPQDNSSTAQAVAAEQEKEREAQAAADAAKAAKTVQNATIQASIKPIQPPSTTPAQPTPVMTNSILNDPLHTNLDPFGTSMTGANVTGASPTVVASNNNTIQTNANNQAIQAKADADAKTKAANDLATALNTPTSTGVKVGDYKSDALGVSNINNGAPMSVNDVLKEFNGTGDALDQSTIKDELTQRLKQLQGQYDDQSAAKAGLVQLALSSIAQNGKQVPGNPGTFIDSMIKGTRDTFQGIGDRLAGGIDAATGGTMNAAQQINDQANQSTKDAIAAKKAGKMDDATFQKIIASDDEQRRVASRMLNKNVENSDPYTMAGAVAGGVALPVALASGVGAGAAGVAGELPTIESALGAGAELTAGTTPAVVSDVLRQKGANATFSDYASPVLMNTLVSMGIPLATSALGLLGTPKLSPEEFARLTPELQNDFMTARAAAADAATGGSTATEAATGGSTATEAASTANAVAEPAATTPTPASTEPTTPPVAPVEPTTPIDANLETPANVENTTTTTPPEMTPEDKSALDVARSKLADGEPMAPEDVAIMNKYYGEPDPNTTAQQSITPVDQPPVTPRDLPTATDIPTAIKTADAEASQVAARAQLLANSEKRILGNNLENRDLYYQAIEHPDQTAAIAQQFGDKADDFLKLIQDRKAVTDFEMSSALGSGVKRPGYLSGEDGAPGYVYHDVNLPDADAETKFSTLKDRMTNGSSSNQRANLTLDDLRNNGFDITDKPAWQQTQEWGARQSKVINDQALKTQFDTLDGNIHSMDGAGGRMWQADNEAMQKQLSGIQPYDPGKVMKTLSGANTFTKQLELLGGMYHDMKFTIRNFWDNAFNGKNPFEPLGTAKRALFDPEFHDTWKADMISQGDGAGGEMMGAAGTLKNTLNGDMSSLVDDLGHGSISKFNPYMKGVFEREGDVFMNNELFNAAKKYYNITPETWTGSAEQVAAMQDIGDQLHNWYGGIDWRSAGISKATQNAMHWMALAPDFTAGKIRSVYNAVSPIAVENGGIVKNNAFFSAPGAMARRQLLSEWVGTAIMSEIGQFVYNGKLNNPVEALTAPQIHTDMYQPMTDANKRAAAAAGMSEDQWQQKYGNKLSIGLPNSTISEAGTAVTDPGRFAANHAGALPSKVIQGFTGKDYYGNPLIDPHQNPNPTVGENMAAAFGTGLTIPGNEAIKVVQGKETPVTAALNTAGFRVSTDKTTPKYQQTQQYYDTLDKYVKNADPNTQAAYNAIHPDVKDTTGNYLLKPGPYDTSTKAGLYLQNNGAALDLERNIQQDLAKQGQKVDPLWLQPRDNIVKYFQYQRFDLKGQQRTNMYQDIKSWYQPLADQRSKFFSTLPPSDPNRPVSSIDFPAPSPQVNDLKNKYYAMPDDTTDDKAARATFLKNNPQVQDQMDKEFKYYNDVLTAQGGVGYKDYPKATPQVQNYIDTYLGAGKATRTALRNSNPGMYQNMIAYFDSTDVAGINSAASQNTLKGNPDTTSTENKKIQSLAQDIYQNADGTYQIVPAGWMNGLSNGSGSSSGGSSYSKSSGLNYYRPADNLITNDGQHPNDGILDIGTKAIKRKAPTLTTTNTYNKGTKNGKSSIKIKL